MPRRLSESPEEAPPSKIIAVFWWIAFIVPVIFVWFAFQSLLLIGIIVAVRIVIMIIPKKKPKQKTKITETVAVPKEPVQKPAKVNIRSNTLSPFKEEAQAEWRWLLKTVRFYDHDREEKYLDDYRRLRGWK